MAMLSIGNMLNIAGNGGKLRTGILTCNLPDNRLKAIYLAPS